MAELLHVQAPPIFLGDASIIRQRYARLDSCLRGLWQPHAIAYSFKTNLQVARGGPFKALGAWAEVVSGREYNLARELGYPGARIVFNGPCKTDAQLTRALSEAALINVNDATELARLISLVSGASTVHGIGIRLNTVISGRKPSRFGFSIEQGEAARALQTIAACPALELSGLHMHLFSDHDDPHSYAEACRKLVAFLATCPRAWTERLAVLNLGGGFPAHTPRPRGRKQWNPRPIEAYLEAMVAELVSGFAEPARPVLMLEPGRYLVSDAVAFVSQIIRAQQVGNKQRLTCNGTLTMLPMTRYAPPLLRAFAPGLVVRAGPRVPTQIDGASCREDDVLYRGPFPRLQAGDYLVHYGVGAYNASLCPEFIFPVPALALLGE